MKTKFVEELRVEARKIRAKFEPVEEQIKKINTEIFDKTYKHQLPDQFSLSNVLTYEQNEIIMNNWEKAEKSRLKLEAKLIPLQMKYHDS